MNIIKKIFNPGKVALMALILTVSFFISGIAYAQSGTTTKYENGPSSGKKTFGNTTLNDFTWYFNNDFPIDGNVLTELQDLGGNWKGIINVVTPKDGSANAGCW